MADSEVPSTQASQIPILREQYDCPHFRILVIGRANAGKTTILEKVCGVAKGTSPIILDKDGNQVEGPSVLEYLMPTIERGIHDIENQITYPGNNFIFHDSQGFESGGNKELIDVWNFIEKRSAMTALRDQLHAIWYCIPMDSPRPLLPAELEFFDKGTGKAPLVAVFTKFDGQVIEEYSQLDDIEDEHFRWEKAEKNADITFQRVYLPKVRDAKCPPKAYVKLADMNNPEMDCPELTEKTADAIDDNSLQELFISTQMNNINLCVKLALKNALTKLKEPTMKELVRTVLRGFPHYWFKRENHVIMSWEEGDDYDDRFFEGSGQLYGGKHYEDTDFFSKGRDELIDELSILFGEEQKESFSITATGCQILAAITIIARESFWINKPLSESIEDAFGHFKEQGNVEKLKKHINPETMPPDSGELHAFLFDLIISI